MNIRFISDYINKDIGFILEIKKYILVAAVIFLISIVYGIIITEQTIEGKDMAKNITKEMMKVKLPTPLSRMVNIFEVNIYNSVIALFPIGSIYIAIINGIAIGSLIEFISVMHGGILTTILMILPHSIIEIPALIISIGIGFRFSHILYMNTIIGSYKEIMIMKMKTDIKMEIKKGIWFYIRYIVPAIFIAAFIESYITPRLLYLII